MIPADAVNALILRAIPDADVDLKDLTGSSDHYEARIVSAVFGGPPIEQHRPVYAAPRDAMHGPIHVSPCGCGAGF